MALHHGKVKWFNDKKGYGFIGPDSGGKDVFFHFSALQVQGFKTVAENASVRYELSDGQKGVVAVNVEVL